MAWRENAVITKLTVEELTMGGTRANGVSLAGTPTGSQLSITGTWGTGFSNAGIYISRTIASQAATSCIERRDITATITGGNYLMGSYNTYVTGASFGATGFLIGEYIRIDCAHLVQDSYAVWGKCAISGAQPGNTSNQHVGVFGSMSIDGVACDLAATGGCYAVLGVASIATGGTLDQPLYAGYFDAGSVDNIAGTVDCVRTIMRNYCDHGVDVHCYTNNNEAGLRFMPTDAARLSSGIKFYASATGGQGYIHHAMEFVAADMKDGAYATAVAITDADDADGVIKIDCAGTHYYIPFYDASVIDKEWADQ
jgi:hypothetical protein